MFTNRQGETIFYPYEFDVTVNKLSKGKDLLDLISQTDCHANTDFIFSSFFS